MPTYGPRFAAKAAPGEWRVYDRERLTVITATYSPSIAQRIADRLNYSGGEERARWLALYRVAA